MLLLLMLVLQEMNMQFVGVARHNVSREESNGKHCSDLGFIQIEGTSRSGNCRKDIEFAQKNVESCRTTCQNYQDSSIPCVFYSFKYSVVF